MIYFNISKTCIINLHLTSWVWIVTTLLLIMSLGSKDIKYRLVTPYHFRSLFQTLILIFHKKRNRGEIWSATSWMKMAYREREKFMFFGRIFAHSLRKHVACNMPHVLWNFEDGHTCYLWLLPFIRPTIVIFL